MNLVDRRLVPRRVEEPVALPVEARIDDDALRDRRRIVFLIGGFAVLVARLIAEDAGSLPVDPLLDRVRIRVDQQLGGVEAVPLFRGIGAVDAVPVALSRADTREVGMPVRALARGQLVADLAAVGTEEAELDALRVLGEEREVRPFAVGSRTEREGPSWAGGQADPPPVSQITASGGSVSSTDHGWFIQSPSAATSSPFPTPEPPYLASSLFTSSCQAPPCGTPTR